MFLGQFDHAVDAKGRVAVPAAFRPQLASGAVVSIGAEGRLMIFPTATFEEHRHILLNITGGTPAEQRRYLRGINAATRSVELDGQGRLLLHPHHRDFAGIGERATFVGMGEHVELCSTERWEEEQGGFTTDSFTDLIDRINPSGHLAPGPSPS